MSTLVKSLELGYLNDRNVEKFFFSDDDQDDFNFKYTPANQFKHIVKDVRRKHTKLEEDRVWATFVQEQDTKYHSGNCLHRICNSKQVLNKNYQQTNEEFDRLELDSLHDRLSYTNDGPERPLYRDLNSLNVTSSPDFSSRNDSDQYDDDDDDSCEARAHPVVAQKILGLQTRISELLDEISYRLCRIPPPDGELDLKRRQQRVVEFSIRFSRNYLYDLGRQMTEIQRHVRAISPNARIKQTRRGIALHMQTLEQKLCSTHQLLANALSAYCKHIPSSILKGHPGKLKDILQVVVDLRDVCAKINLTAEYFGAGDTAPPPLGKDTQKRCYTILSKLRLNSDNESPLFSRSTQSTLIGPPVSDLKKSNNRVDSRKKLPNRFSMYTVDSRFNKAPKRRPATLGLYQKERRSNTGKLPLQNSPPTPKQPHPSLASLKSKKSVTRRGRVKSKIHKNEDEIRTMMDLLPPDSEAGSSALQPRNCQSAISNVSKLKNQVKQCDTNSTIPVLEPKKSEIQFTEQHLTSLIPAIADLLNLITNKQNNPEIALESISMDTFLTALHEYLSQRKRENTHEDSASKSKSTENERKISQSNFVPEEKEKEQLSQVLDEPKETSPINIGLNGGIGRTQLVVSKESADRLMNYRDEYQNACRSSPMYTSNGPNKPWEVVAWISDKLVDELVVEISKELQMDDMVQKMFDLEFQEF